MLQLALSAQVVCKSRDGHVGDGEQLVEDDPVLGQTGFVVGLEARLAGRQVGADRVVYKVEDEPVPFP